MNRIFRIGEMFPVPDGTQVCPFLNPFDTNEKELPTEVLSGMSIAAGEIGAARQSKIHVHPLLWQVTWVIEGDIRVKMKGVHDSAPYTVDLQKEQAVLIEPQTFLQLINQSRTAPVRVLYLLTPAYVFDKEGDRLKYDDAIVLEESWEDLERINWSIPKLKNLSDIAVRRKDAIQRITMTKQRGKVDLH